MKTSQVVSKAREYVGTPFRHQARVKGLRGGIDCIGLVMCVGEDLGLHYTDGAAITRSDYTQYAAMPVDSFVHEECCRRLVRKDKKALAPGDIVTMKVPYQPCHAGILTGTPNSLSMVHAYNSGTEKVVEHLLDEKWLSRIVGVFSYPGVE